MEEDCITASKPPSQGAMQCTTRGQSLPPATRSIPNSTTDQQPTQAIAEELDQAAETTIGTAGRKRSYSETNDFRSAAGTGHAGRQHTRARKDDSDPTVSSFQSGRTALVATSGTRNGMALDIIDEDLEYEDSNMVTVSSRAMDHHQYLNTTPEVIASPPARHASALYADSDGSQISSGSDDDVEILKPKRKPTNQRFQPGKKSAGRKPSSKSRAGSNSEESDADSSEYDPETCGVYSILVSMRLFSTANQYS